MIPTNHGRFHLFIYLTTFLIKSTTRGWFYIFIKLFFSKTNCLWLSLYNYLILKIKIDHMWLIYI